MPTKESESQVRVREFVESLDRRTRTTGFAVEFERNEQGWINFPRDVEIRKRLFPNPDLGSATNAFNHPAKQPLYIVRESIEYLTDPGDWVLDPFGGIGSAALASRMGRNTLLVELETFYADTIKEGAAILVPDGYAIDGPNYWTWMPVDEGRYGQIRLYVGDNRRVLPTLASKHPPIKLILTSPPYALSVNRKGHELETDVARGVMKDYAGSGLNLSQLNSFYWEDAMEKVWERSIALLEPGGYLVWTCRDTIANGTRDMLSIALMRQAKKFGMRQFEWHKWALPMTLRQAVNIQNGGGAVTEEDIIIMVKE